jgi:hypothetical protein
MNLRITSIPNLIDFLKKLKVVDKSVLLELTQTELFSKTHTPDKSVMKCVRIPFLQVFEGTVETGNSDRIKIGLVDVARFIDCFKNFKQTDMVYLEIVTSDQDGHTVGISLKAYTDSMKINFRCAELGLMSYIEDNILGLVHGTEDAIGSFRFYRSDFETVISLCGLENNSEELLEFSVLTDPPSVQTAGQSFEYKLDIATPDIDASEPATLAIYKKQLGYVDLEQSMVFYHENRLIFKSTEKESTIAIGLIQK